MDKMLKYGVILILVAAVCFAGIQYGIPAIQQGSIGGGNMPSGMNSYLYTSNLQVAYTVSDSATATAVTSGVVPQFFSATANPFNYYAADLAMPFSTAYSATVNAWQSNPSAGNYKLVIGAAATYYPAITSVSVTGTNTTNLNGQPVSVMTPASFSMVQRATPSITATVRAYNVTSGLYDIPASNISTTTYNKWQVTYTISAAGVLGQQIKAGTIYMPIIQGLAINGAVASWSTAAGQQVTVAQDTTGLTTGLVGYTVAFPDINAGVSYTLTVNLQEAGTLTGLPVAFNTVLHDASDINNANFRWWADATCSTIYVEAA